MAVLRGVCHGRASGTLAARLQGVEEGLARGIEKGTVVGVDALVAGEATEQVGGAASRMRASCVPVDEKLGRVRRRKASSMSLRTPSGMGQAQPERARGKHGPQEQGDKAGGEEHAAHRISSWLESDTLYWKNSRM